jgi:hypothetical protein
MTARYQRLLYRKATLIQKFLYKLGLIELEKPKKCIALTYQQTQLRRSLWLTH